MDVTKAMLRRAQRYSILSKKQLFALTREALSVASLSGDVAELGSYRGGSAILLAHALPHKIVRAFESFEGLHNLSTLDNVRIRRGESGHALGDFRIGIQERKVIRKRLVQNQVKLHEGFFIDESKRVSMQSFCFAHFDADTYDSAWEFLMFFCPRLTPGGKMVLDDYNNEATPGVKRALEAVVRLNPYLRIHALPTGQTILKKPRD